MNVYATVAAGAVLSVLSACGGSQSVDGTPDGGNEDGGTDGSGRGGKDSSADGPNGRRDAAHETGTDGAGTRPDGRAFDSGSDASDGSVHDASADVEAGTITTFAIPTMSPGVGWIVSGPDDNLWFTEYNGDKIGRVSTTGVVAELPIPIAHWGPADITTGPDGALWLTSISGNNIGRMTTTGEFTESGGNNIGRITPGGVITEFPIPTAASFPFYIAPGPDGSSGSQSSPRSKSVASRQTVLCRSSLFPRRSMRHRGALSPDRDGALWFTESDT